MSDLVLQKERIGRLKEDLQVLLSPLSVKVDFDNLWKRLEFALAIEDMASVAAQVFFSMTLYTGAWANAIDRYWYDPFTGDHYESKEDAPQDAQLRVQWREVKRWETQEQFVQYARAFRPRATLWFRHRLLMQKVTLWKHANASFGNDIPIEVFFDLAKGVVTAPAITDIIVSNVVDVATGTDDIRVVDQASVNRMLANNVLPDDDPGYKRQVAQVLLERIEEMEEIAKTSRVSEAKKQVLSDILKRPSVSVRLLSPEEGDYIEIVATAPSDDDGSIHPSERYRMVFVNDSGEVVGYSDLSPVMKSAVLTRFRFLHSD